MFLLTWQPKKKLPPPFPTSSVTPKKNPTKKVLPKKMFVFHPWWFQGPEGLKMRTEDDDMQSAHHEPQAAVCLPVCMGVTLTSYYSIWFSYMSTKAYKVVKGTSKSWTDKLRTVMQTTDIPVAKDFKLTWREIWEIHVVSIMKDDFIEKDKACSVCLYGWLPKMATCSKRSIGHLLASAFVSASILALIKSLL